MGRWEIQKHCEKYQHESHQTTEQYLLILKLTFNLWFLASFWQGYSLFIYAALLINAAEAAFCRFLVTFGVISAGASKRPDDGWILMVILGIFIVTYQPKNHTKCHQMEVGIAILHFAILRLTYLLFLFAVCPAARISRAARCCANLR